MKLTRFAYFEFPSSPTFWELKEFELGDINLFVGKNARGKSRTLIQVASLGKRLTGKIPTTNYNSGNWKATFAVEPEDFPELLDDKEVTYELQIKGGAVQFEHFRGVNNKDYLKRDNNGLGNLYAKELKGNMSFQLDTKQIAAVSKKDSIQHPFLDPLIRWARSVRWYAFGADIMQQSITFIVAQNVPKEATEQYEIEDSIIPLLVAAETRFGPDFTRQVCEYMNTLGYPVEKIELTPATMQALVIGGISGQSPMLVTVTESDRQAPLAQVYMSAGMFRTLAILIRAELAKRLELPFVLVIDDIGEGLDFERAKSLIRLLIDIAKVRHMQLLMSTNDRFVMNEVPLDYWNVVLRQRATVRIINKSNAPLAFKKFEEFGFNNFDFFAKEFYLDDDNVTTTH